MQKPLENIKPALDRPSTFWLVLIGICLWKIFLAWKLDIVKDEGYYFFWSLSPQLSYLDHPPLTAWAMALSHLAFGDSIWTVRCWPLAVGLLFPVFGRALAGEMFDPQTANRAGIFLTLSPAFAGNGFLMTPDALLGLCWSVVLYATWKALITPVPNVRWWALAGLGAGLGLLAKYNMVLYFFGLGLLFLIWPAKRHNLFYGMLLAGAIAVILFSPVIAWNFENHWLSFRFQLLHGFSAKHSRPLANFAEYVGGLLLVVTPLLGALAFWCSALALAGKNEARRFLAVFFAAVVLFFAVSALRRKVEANWPMLAFFSGVILVAADWHRFHRWLRRATVGLLVLAIVPAMIYLSLPADFAISIAGHPLDIARMEEFYGGPQVATAVRKKARQLQVDFICASRHTLLGEIAFYAPGLRPLLWLPNGGRQRFPWIDERQWEDKTALLVSIHPRRWPWFKKVQPAGKIRIPFKKNLARSLYFYRGIGYKPSKR